MSTSNERDKRIFYENIIRLSTIAMTPTLPPNPCLVAILLVVKSRNGPRFVFHYPPHAREDGISSHSAWGDAYGTSSSLTDDSSADSDDQEWSSEDDEPPHFKDKHLKHHDPSDAERSHRPHHKRTRNPDDDEGDSSGDDIRHQEGEVGWEKVLGIGTDGLEKILTPSRAFNKKKFELTLDPLVFLSRPIFIREDGRWRKKRARPKSQGRGVEADAPNDNINGKEKAKDEGSLEKGNGAEAGSDYESGVDEGEDAEDPEHISTSTEDNMHAMTMFNVVFVLNPPALEYQIRVKEMYENIAKKFAKALKWEQARSNFVWTESDIILSLKETAKEKGTSINTLWSSILSKSSLALAISKVYSSISASKIAHVLISSSSVSLQIPQIISTPVLPTITEPQMPGLWLTTANSRFDDTDALPTTNLAKHFALLLLDDEASILKDISNERSELSGPLEHYIRSSKPTLSFLQVSIASGIPLADIQFLASHLIYWRRARAIPPLHVRDTYIVSPNANMQLLASATQNYAATFPTLPSLPKMLSLLSGIPRPIGNIIPSKDHRPAYLEILSWLLRGGWVTQLRTFAWIRVPSEIKAAVAATQSERELSNANIMKDNGNEYHSDTVGYSPMSSRRSSNNDDSLNPPRRPGYLSPPLALSETGSTSSSQTAIPPSSPINRRLSASSLSSFRPSLILDPHKANAQESRWIDAIGASFEGEEEDVRTYWPVFVKYFNGQHALEKIAVREGVKRKEVWRVLAVIEAKGVLQVVRHW
ncbi:MAG: Nitrogen permease regulator 3 [Pycnora praestabilis]|nr:MAG: Nitrogen permease regulator 3 [Pycnora praestabilis]